MLFLRMQNVIWTGDFAIIIGNLHWSRHCHGQFDQARWETSVTSDLVMHGSDLVGLAIWSYIQRILYQSSIINVFNFFR